MHAQDLIQFCSKLQIPDELVKKEESLDALTLRVAVLGRYVKALELGDLQSLIDSFGDSLDLSIEYGGRSMLQVTSGDAKSSLPAALSAIAARRDDAELELELTVNKKKILREKMLKVEPFKSIILLLKKAGGKMERDDLIDAVSKKFLIEDRAMFLKLLIGWGNYSETFEYDSDEETFVLSPLLL